VGRGSFFHPAVFFADEKIFALTAFEKRGKERAIGPVGMKEEMIHRGGSSTAPGSG